MSERPRRNESLGESIYEISPFASDVNVICEQTRSRRISIIRGAQDYLIVQKKVFVATFTSFSQSQPFRHVQEAEAPRKAKSDFHSARKERPKARRILLG